MMLFSLIFQKKGYCDIKKMSIFAASKCLIQLFLTVKRMPFDLFSMQALQVLHRFRAVMFSPTSHAD